MQPRPSLHACLLSVKFTNWDALQCACLLIPQLSNDACMAVPCFCTCCMFLMGAAYFHECCLV
eukprot:346753-Pelagomonas_calceolata.AAC.2